MMGLRKSSLPRVWIQTKWRCDVCSNHLQCLAVSCRETYLHSGELVRVSVGVCVVCVCLSVCLSACVRTYTCRHHRSGQRRTTRSSRRTKRSENATLPHPPRPRNQRAAKNKLCVEEIGGRGNCSAHMNLYGFALGRMNESCRTSS